ncbi:MAG: hypothetical protein HY516_00915 [Candidatus Aenigmarchaeota archaeon]|nr:hypothetical protein [Candidatus Aenigmarchaeota archaeon]
MKTPICSVCLQSDILCASCSRNIATKKISPAGLRIIKKLHEISRNVRSLENVSVEKIIDTESLIAIVCGKSDVANLVGREGRITNELRKISGKQVKIVGEGDYKSIISSLMFPAAIEGVGKLYSGGRESLKINMRRNQMRNLPAKKDDLLLAASEITGLRAEFNFQ